jgi:RNA polymerase sigma factor (sigma-70 family)
MTSGAANRNVQEDGAAQRESGVHEKVTVQPEEDPRAQLGALFRAEGARLLVWLTRRVPAQAAVDLHAAAFLALLERADDRRLEGDPADLLYYMALNQVRNHRRAQQRQRQRDGGVEADAVPRSDRDVERAAIAAEDARFVAELLAELTAEDAALIRRVDVEEVAAQEVAAALGISVDAAWKRLSRARARLGELARRRARGR